MGTLFVPGRGEKEGISNFLPPPDAKKYKRKERSPPFCWGGGGKKEKSATSRKGPDRGWNSPHLRRRKKKGQAKIAGGLHMRLRRKGDLHQPKLFPPTGEKEKKGKIPTKADHPGTRGNGKKKMRMFTYDPSFTIDRRGEKRKKRGLGSISLINKNTEKTTFAPSSSLSFMRTRRGERVKKKEKGRITADIDAERMKRQ